MAKDRSLLPTLPKEQFKQLLTKAQERSKAGDAERAREKERFAGNALSRYAERVARRKGFIHEPLHKEILDHYASGGTYEDEIPEKTMKELNKWRKKWDGGPLGRTSAANWLRSIIEKNPSSKLTIYNWLEANEPDALNEGQWETVKKFRELNDLAKKDDLQSNGETSADLEASVSDWMDSDSYKKEQALANKHRSLIDDFRETIASKEREKDAVARERWRKQEEAAIPGILPAPKPEAGSLEEDTQSLIDAYTPWAEKSMALINEAKKYGFKGDLERKLTAGYDREFKANGGDGEKAFDTLRDNLYKNANKKFMAQRGAQMNADLKARQDAVRNNPRAAQRRAALKAQWGNPTMSQAQIEAAARWKNERQTLSGNSGNKAAFQEQKAYRASPQYGQDVYGMAQQQGRTLTPGSVGHTYEQNFNHNQRMMEAEERAAQANAATVQGIASAVDKVPVNGNPTPAQTKAIAQTPMTTGADPNKNFGS